MFGHFYIGKLGQTDNSLIFLLCTWDQKSKLVCVSTCKTCLERPLPWETTCLKEPDISYQKITTFQLNWTCHQRPRVLQDLIFYGQWGSPSKQVLLFWQNEQHNDLINDADYCINNLLSFFSMTTFTLWYKCTFNVKYRNIPFEEMPYIFVQRWFQWQYHSSSLK